MIFFTGDIHGAVDGIAEFITKVHPTMKDVIVLLGDVGANYYIPVYLAEAKMLADRLAEEEKIGIVPEGVLPAYCGSWFPNEHIIDYMNLPSEDREKFLPFCTWYEERPAALAQREET